MRKSIFILLLTCICISGYAQEKKNYKPLLRELNKMLKDAEEFSWMYEPDFEIVQPYKISNDTLSVAIRGMYDDRSVIHKYEAPLTNIYDYVWDIYYVLSFNNKAVKVSELKNNEWIVIGEQDYFHLGKLSDELSEGWSKNFRRLLNKLYPLKNEFDFMD